MSSSSTKGALASIAASVIGMDVSWFDSVGVWWFGVEYCGEEKGMKSLIGKKVGDCKNQFMNSA